MSLGEFLHGGQQPVWRLPCLELPEATGDPIRARNDYGHPSLQQHLAPETGPYAPEDTKALAAHHGRGLPCPNLSLYPSPQPPQDAP